MGDMKKVFVVCLLAGGLAPGLGVSVHKEDAEKIVFGMIEEGLKSEAEIARFMSIQEGEGYAAANGDWADDHGLGRYPSKQEGDHYMIEPCDLRVDIELS